MPDRNMRQILTKANKPVWELKEKQFRTLALLLSVLVLLSVAHEFHRVLGQGLGNPKNLIGSTLAWLLIPTSLLPSTIISYRKRIHVFIMSGFIVSVSGMVTAGTSGSGYILLVLDAFIVHYFLKEKKNGYNSHYWPAGNYDRDITAARV
ncbi:MAG: hypothetical protein JXX14_03480 [Deltaproteobacteria bacterium]|nr:hypothetical protein [Deltaproteobacteria bacterium]